MHIRMLFKENKFIKLLLNLKHQLKQCIENDSVRVFAL